MNKVLFFSATVLHCVSFSYAFQAFTADQKLRQCEDGELTYQRVTGVHEETVTFYMQTTAQNERDCVMMCYERLQFCNSVKFVPDDQGNGESGTCSFAYYRGDCHDTGRTSHGLIDVSAVTFAIPTNMFSCIRCVPYVPSFVQASEDNNEVGPALLVQQRTTTEKPRDAIDRKNVAKNHLSYREYKSFNYLLPACSGNLTYSSQATLMMTKPSVYTAGMNIATVRECAVLCYRQHFCTSAIWRADECLLSYEKGVCSDRALPAGYRDAVLISCLKCNDQ